MSRLFQRYGDTTKRQCGIRYCNDCAILLQDCSAAQINLKVNVCFCLTSESCYAEFVRKRNTKYHFYLRHGTIEAAEKPYTEVFYGKCLQQEQIVSKNI